MKRSKTEAASHQLWAKFRFGVIGGLFSKPPEPQELQARIRELATEQWIHPISGEKFTISFSTIERWYYRSRNQAPGSTHDPLGVLRRKVRADAGKHRQLTLEVKQWLEKNYQLHGSWSRKLHYDNLRRWLKKDQLPVPSYDTVLRYMKFSGWDKKPRVRSPMAPGRLAAEARLREYEVRSYEVEHVGALWHLDFHHCSRQIMTDKGERVTPLALCIMDDHSRLCCHLQWYWWEDTRALVHGFVQALQKRGLPRALMSDNGAAMKAAEFIQGLERLGIIHNPTLAYSPYQNGKQESFWGSLEGRMMAMLELDVDLTLDKLNQYTQAWVEMEYNRNIHSETKEAPVDRYLQGKSVLREAPRETSAITLLFRRDEGRTQRRSDGTLSILGRRFEVPVAYRTLPRITVRYAEWDLRQVHLVDPRTQVLLAPLYPLDRLKNSEGRRRKLGSDTIGTTVSVSNPDPIPPLLKDLVAEYAASGLPPAYLADPRPYHETTDKTGKEPS